MAVKRKHTPEQEKVLISKAKNGDIASRRELHTEYAALINVITRKFMNSEIPQTSLNMHAHDLLDNFINTYNPYAGAQPNTYFYNSISDKLKRYVIQNRGNRYTDERLYHAIPRYHAALDELQQEHNRQPSIEELTHRINRNLGTLKGIGTKPFTVPEIDFIHNSIRETIPTSFSLSSNEEDTLTAGDTAFLSEDPDEAYEEKLKIQRALNSIQALPDLHRKVILHSYDIPGSGYDKLSERNIGLKLGLTRYQITKIRNEAEKMLRGES